MLKVELPPEVTEVGESVAVAPAGAPETLSDTVWAAPEVVAVAMVELAEPPAVTETLAGLAEMEKSFAATALTVKVTEVEWVADAAVPVTVKAYVPAAAVPEFSVSVLLPPAVTDAGLNDAVAPAGKPLTLSETVSAVPETSAVEMVVLPPPPAVTETVAGLALMEKSLAAVTPPQPGNLKEPMRVLQLKAPFAGMYSVVNQKVQSSLGSTVMLL